MSSAYGAAAEDAEFLLGDAEDATETQVGIPLSLRLLTIAIFLPSEISFRILGLFFSPARLLLLILVPVVLVRLGSSIANRRYRFVWSDLFAMATGVWLFVALLHTESLHDAMTSGGPLALEFSIGYLAYRVLLRERGQALSLVTHLCHVAGIVGLLGLADTLTHQLFVHEMAGFLFGGTKYPDAGSRLGLIRAASTADHPILLGFTCSVGFLLAAAVPIRGRTFALWSCGLGTFLALSSAPIQGVVMGLGLLVYRQLLPGFRSRWTALMVLAAIAVALVFSLVSNPFGFIFNHLCFDAESAYYRIYIWQMAGPVVTDNPWFGLGLVIPDGYDIPSSVDSVWLVWSLNFGLPGALLLALSILGATSLPTGAPNIGLTSTEIRLGLVLGILIFNILFLGFTVDFFGEEWILLPLLAALRAHLGELGAIVPPSDA